MDCRLGVKKCFFEKIHLNQKICHHFKIIYISFLSTYSRNLYYLLKYLAVYSITYPIRIEIKIANENFDDI